MSFFGALFAAITLHWQFHVAGPLLALPFLGFAAIGLGAAYVVRQPGTGLEPSPKAARMITISSIGEGVGLFIASNLVVNLHHEAWLLPAMALVVGLHFIPIAHAAAFRPFYALGGGLIIGALAGFVIPAPTGGAISGFLAVICLWIAASAALWRDARFRRASLAATA
ncbi:hypothetical protein [Novosphingobium terrae]|uniref:hypothetical protein n=1 Tax=Novosphingobium terrae TaxID=2726189 RepID=UPI001F144D65|nr:hypothetical protein [Novosphingobium terrae]